MSKIGKESRQELVEATTCSGMGPWRKSIRSGLTVSVRCASEAGAPDAYRTQGRGRAGQGRDHPLAARRGLGRAGRADPPEHPPTRRAGRKVC